MYKRTKEEKIIVKKRIDFEQLKKEKKKQKISIGWDEQKKPEKILLGQE